MDQRTLWNAFHSEAKLAVYSQAPTEFAHEVVRLLPDHANVLELGCGFGTDAAFFAQRGHSVLATDLSEIAIARNKREHTTILSPNFQVLDMRDGTLPFAADEFDAVYARLSLHYYPDHITRSLFQEIHRVLKRGGRLAFLCKSTSDPLYGKGQQLEAGMFDYKGHVRHFFNHGYTKSLLDGGDCVEKLEERKEDLYGQPSAYIKVIAQKV